MIAVLLAILLLWGFSTKKGDPINPPKPISNESCKDFKPKKVPGLPQFDQKALDAYNDYAKRTLESSKKVYFGKDLVGERFIDNPLSP